MCTFLWLSCLTCKQCNDKNSKSFWFLYYALCDADEGKNPADVLFRQTKQQTDFFTLCNAEGGIVSAKRLVAK
jgi:hypothetical protein